jgi:hypothetical protein
LLNAKPELFGDVLRSLKRGTKDFQKNKASSCLNSSVTGCNDVELNQQRIYLLHTLELFESPISTCNFHNAACCRQSTTDN